MITVSYRLRFPRNPVGLCAFTLVYSMYNGGSMAILAILHGVWLYRTSGPHANLKLTITLPRHS